jgi:outer membrane protein assembly factor BamE (lipoprotein component of BamABCDE complex)
MKFVSGRKLALGAVLVGLGAGAAACSSTENRRGYMETPGMLEAIRVGVDTKQSLQASLGSPSTLGTFSDNTWYYITTLQEDQLFFEPEETERKVVAVNFGAGDVVQSVQTYGKDDGVEVSFSRNETPARGRELSFLQQIFGNIGRSGPVGGINNEADDPRNRR